MFQYRCAAAQAASAAGLQPAAVPAVLAIPAPPACRPARSRLLADPISRLQLRVVHRRARRTRRWNWRSPPAPRWNCPLRRHATGPIVEMMPALREATAMSSSPARGLTKASLAGRWHDQAMVPHHGPLCRAERQSRCTAAMPDLAGKRIGVVAEPSMPAGSRSITADSEIVPFDDAAKAGEALRTGKVDAVFGDNLRLIYWVAGQASGGCCRLLGGAYSDFDYFSRNLAFLVRPTGRTCAPPSTMASTWPRRTAPRRKSSTPMCR